MALPVKYEKYSSIIVAVPKNEIGTGVGGRSRGGETATFLRRAMLFLDGLKQKRYPNASTLARLSGCSRSTAMRTIDRLRYEFGVPIEYEEIHRGYYLTRADFTLAIPPASREELFVLCLALDLALFTGDTSIRGAIDALWARLAIGRSDVEREQFRERIIIEPVVALEESGIDLLRLLVICHREDLVRVRYRSPWLKGDGVDYVGRLVRIRVAHGRVHVLFVCSNGVHAVLNAAFIVSMVALPDDMPDGAALCPVGAPDEAWYSGDGEWSGGITEVVEVRIAAPASRYYGAQVWQPDQEDTWEGDTLVRRFSSAVSIELAGRILSLGRAVVSVKPDWVLEELRIDVANLRRLYAALDGVEALP